MTSKTVSPISSFSSLSVKEVRSSRELRNFIRFPWKIYRGNPYWVPPLIKDHLQRLGPTHPFRSHAEMILFLAYQDKEIVGRIAGIIDHHYIEYHGQKTGFFGFFEAIPDPNVSDALFSKVKSWLKDRGIEKIAGPMNPSTNDECGLLIDCFDECPCLMMPYNPKYYSELMDRLGFHKAMDLYAYSLGEDHFQLDRLQRITEKRLKKEPQLRIRPLNLRRLEDELKIVKELYNQVWSKNWGFVPLTEPEIDDLAKNLKPLVLPDLVLFAYWGEEPVGFSVALPDYNEVLRHLNGKIGLIGAIKYLYYSKKIKKIRVMLLGVKHGFQKKGIEGVLYIETFKRGIQNNYRLAECSWVLESNPLMQHGLEAMGGKRQKTYRIYEAPL